MSGIVILLSSGKSTELQWGCMISQRGKWPMKGGQWMNDDEETDKTVANGNFPDKSRLICFNYEFLMELFRPSYHLAERPPTFPGYHFHRCCFLISLWLTELVSVVVSVAWHGERIEHWTVSASTSSDNDFLVAYPSTYNTTRSSLGLQICIERGNFIMKLVVFFKEMKWNNVIGI